MDSPKRFVVQLKTERDQMGNNWTANPRIYFSCPGRFEFYLHNFKVLQSANLIRKSPRIREMQTVLTRSLAKTSLFDTYLHFSDTRSTWGPLKITLVFLKVPIISERNEAFLKTKTWVSLEKKSTLGTRPKRFSPLDFFFVSLMNV